MLTVLTVAGTVRSWFQSQFGNKLIYTGAGAADIVLSSRLNLPENIQVRVSECCAKRAVLGEYGLRMESLLRAVAMRQ